MTFNGYQAIVEPALGTGISYFYRLNSVYDPDSSGVGTSATGYSTWAGHFLNYKVHRATVRVRAVASGATGGAVQAIIAPVPGQAVVPANFSLWRSIRGNSTKIIAPVTVGGQNVWEFTRTYELAQWLQVTKSQFQNDMDFSGAIASNPARQLYLMIGCAAVNGSAPGALAFTIDITYQVEWFNQTPMQL